LKSVEDWRRQDYFFVVENILVEVTRLPAHLIPQYMAADRTFRTEKKNEEKSAALEKR